MDEPAPAGGSATDTNNRQLENPPDEVYRLEIYCRDINSGRIIWKRIPFKDKPTYRTHRDNTYASETAVTDGRHIYVYFGNMGLYCYDYSGNLIWKKDLGVYEMQSDRGTSTLPLLYDGQLFMQIDNEEKSFLTSPQPKEGLPARELTGPVPNPGCRWLHRCFTRICSTWLTGETVT